MSRFASLSAATNRLSRVGVKALKIEGSRAEVQFGCLAGAELFLPS
jgi:hypothetical protein